MNCEEYITKYLSVHADGELTPEEEYGVAEHLGSGADDGCAACRGRFAEERLLKALIRRQAATVKTPEELQAHVCATLDQFDRGPLPRRVGVAVVRELGRPRIWIPLAAAAVLIVALLVGGGLPGIRRGTWLAGSGVSAIPASQALDQAVRSYENFENGFRPNVPSHSLAAIATAYGAAQMPNDMWNFQYAGYNAVGGRLDRLPDGNPVSYTLYRGRNGDILCARYKASDFTIPRGALAEHDSHSFYMYKGYSLCLTVSEEGHFICVLTTTAPMEQFRHDVSLAEAFSFE